VRAPVGEHSARRRHEPPLRDLDDAHAMQDSAHRRLATTAYRRAASALRSAWWRSYSRADSSIAVFGTARHGLPGEIGEALKRRWRSGLSRLSWCPLLSVGAPRVAEEVDWLPATSPTEPQIVENPHVKGGVLPITAVPFGHTGCRRFAPSRVGLAPHELGPKRLARFPRLKAKAGLPLLHGRLIML